jgi:hypothetical protein
MIGQPSTIFEPVRKYSGGVLLLAVSVAYWLHRTPCGLVRYRRPWHKAQAGDGLLVIVAILLL